MHPAQLRQGLPRSLHTAQGVQLPGDQHQPDPGQHPVHDGDGDRPEPPPEPQHPHAQLRHSGGQHQHPERRQTVGLHRLVDEHGETGRGPAHLEGAPAEPPGDQPADHPGDDPQLGRHSGGDRHPDAQG